MSDRAAHLRRRVQAAMPGLEIHEIEPNDEGLVNDVVIVNRELVFRFAKTQAYADYLATETRILHLIRPHLTVPVPRPIYRSRDRMIYPMLPGQPLTRRLVQTLSGEDRRSVAEQLGRFLWELHTVDVAGAPEPIPRTRAPVSREQTLSLRDRVREKVFPLLLSHQVRWAEGLFAEALDDPGFFDHKPALIHADLAPYHILYDTEGGKLTGVIDFGVAGLGDPALDIGTLITAYGETFVREMAPAYPDLVAKLPRARFDAQRIELEWVLLGMETGEAFWFTAHLGGARDIGV